ncbi:MAG: hypothetical protein KAI79_07425 [Bacteroidales bacterium]|nr:hypothetical protein [Bacteroidales bacterium]
MNQTVEKKSFSPLLFLGSLGSGGLAIAFFAILQYTIDFGPGLVKMSHIHDGDFSALMKSMYLIFEGGMIFFTALHLVMTLVFLKMLFSWMKTDDYKNTLNNPITNSSLITPFISLTMTMNVFLAVVRYFIPAFSDDLQALMLPGLISWAILWFFLMKAEIKILGISFMKGFNINDIHFGWLLHPFALSMVTVTGAGVAAMAMNPMYAHISFIMLSISGTKGLFLLLVKLVALFTSHFAKDGLPEKQFMPSFLIVIPIVTLFSISAYRIGHYLEHHYGSHLSAYFMIVTVVPFAFQLWYMTFGLHLLKKYFNSHFRREFHVSQWGLVCPFVALTVLSSLVYQTFSQSSLVFWFTTILLAITSFLILGLLRRQLRCFGLMKGRDNFECN